MQYQFSGFILDTEKKVLTFDSKTINLTKQNYQLLKFSIEQAGKVINKEQLINGVWEGRIVADNTIDQSIYKLKKTLTNIQKDQYFKTIYGLGIKFIADVQIIEDKKPVVESKEKFISYKSVILSIVIFASIFTLYIVNRTLETSQLKDVDISTESSKPLFLIYNNEEPETDNWLKSAPNLFLQEALNTTSTFLVKNIQDKPKNLTNSQYIETQWQISPKLKVLTTNISQVGDQFELLFSLTNKNGIVNKKQFKNNNISIVFKQGIAWLNNQESDPNVFSFIQSQIPENPYLLELYMRGLLAVNNRKIEKAINYFELCLKEDPNYHLAVLELAKLMDRNGDQQKALALLDTITLTSPETSIQIKAQIIRGGILLRQGKPYEAQEIYTKLINQYDEKQFPNLINARHKLSIVYRTLSQNQKSLDALTQVEESLKEEQSHSFLADVLQAKGSLLLRIGHTQQAIVYANQALDLFNQLGDLTGQAKTHGVIARIARHQANYAEAIVHLNQSLNITRAIDFKFGIGATLNEIIGILIAQGKINEASQLNQELEEIAIAIDFTAMLLASKEYTIKISSLLKQWVKAEIYLKEHLALSQASNNTRSLTINKFLTLLALLDQAKIEKISPLIEDLQSYIDESKEIRLQPQLNILKARTSFLNNQNSKAVSMLIASKKLASETDDGESMIEIHTLLAKHYIKSNENQKALDTLAEISNYNPIAQPYLMLKSKAYSQLRQLSKAIEFASLCKRQSNDLWTIADEQYLTNIIQLKKNESEKH